MRRRASLPGSRSLRHGAELLALRVAHQPLDLDRLLALLGLADRDRAFDPIGAGVGLLGERDALARSARAGWRPSATCCRRPARRSRRHDRASPGRRGRCCRSSGWAAADGRSARPLPAAVARLAAAAAARRSLAARRRSTGCADVGGDAPAGSALGSQAAKELAALPAIDCATCGVSAAHGSLEALPATTSSPVMRLTRLPVGSVTSQM